MRFQPIYHITSTRLREMLREPEAIFWVFIFPVLLTVGLGIAFRAQPEEILPVGVVEGPRAAWAQERLEASDALTAELLDEASARQELRTGRIALAVLPDPSAGWIYWADPTRPESRLAELWVDRVLQQAEGTEPAFVAGTRDMQEKGSRYIDFLVPGLLGMNLMGTGMWGIGFYIVSARSKGLLKRMVATPMRRSHFMFGQFVMRLLFLALEVGVLLTFAHLFFDVPIRGSILTLVLVCLLSAMVFSGLGLLVASRARTIEGVSGLMNFVMMPMWILSGIFFSTARFPDLVQPLIQALPLTAVNDALRAVMLEGSSLVGIAGELAIIGGWCVVSYVGAIVLFRWI